MIYLDNCATTKPDDEVVKVMLNYLQEDFANPSSIHSFGHKVQKKLQSARLMVSEFINADSDEVFFTSGGTESNNISINGLVNKNKRNGKKIITTSFEHSSISEVFKHLESIGYEVIYIPVDSYGNVNRDVFLNSIDKDTIVVSLIHVQNEIGTIIDVKNLIRDAKSINNKILFHVDGVQAFGKIPVDVKDIGCDTYSMSSHKIYGPKGVGAIYKRKSIEIEPLVYGGAQERNLRSGTENVPGILGFAKACELMKNDFYNRSKHALDLKTHLLERLEEFSDYRINTPKNSSNYVLSISFKNIRAEVLVHYLEQDEIYISTASACTSNGTKKSGTLASIGLSNDYMEGTIRICFAKYNSLEDIDKFVDKLKIYVDEIRSIMVR